MRNQSAPQFNSNPARGRRARTITLKLKLARRSAAVAIRS